MRSKSRRASGVLQVRREQPEPAFEHLRRSGHAAARQERRRDAALRRPAGVQELRVRAVHPAFENARGEAAADARRLRHLPRRRVRAAGPPGTSRRTARTVPSDESRAGETAPARRCRRGTRSRCRRRSRRSRSRPEIGRRLRQRERGGDRGLLMCTIDSLCVSSYSSACENEPLANAAVVTPTRSPPPKMRHGPGGDMATAAARVARPNGVSAPASARPIDVEDAQLRRIDDVLRQIVEGDAASPLSRA